MSESKHRRHARQESANAIPYWKRAHHDWRFWAGLVLMFLAITVYILSDNLAFVPRN